MVDRGDEGDGSDDVEQNDEMDQSKNVSSRSTLRVLLLVAGILSALLVLPFLQPILLAGLLAYLARPAQVRLAPRLGRTIAAAVTMTATVVVVLAPILLLLAVAATQAVLLLRGVEVPDIAAIEAVFRGWLGTNPPDLSVLAEPVAGALQAGLQGILGGVVGFLGGVPAFLVGTVVFFFAFFSFLRDGDRLVAWIRAAIPLNPATMDELIERTDDLLWAAVVGNVIVAALQAVLTVLGFVAVGFDNIIFWGMTTFVLALLPIIGASVVWIPAVLYLLSTGSIPEAVGLLVYGSIVISGSDNVVRPFAMKRGAELDTGVLVIGIFGGIAVFGFLGLFIGPVVLGLAKTLVELLVRERGEPV
ncbi:AI-2E family transporter [Haloarchaeobius sp. TZWSO28]|uniref:AI-2E family transporter n=1 Tax=Haloarchaeobius sp. TZWSO28 TaxID=3446119 RepID=UPI003EB93175